MKLLMNFPMKYHLTMNFCGISRGKTMSIGFKALYAGRDRITLPRSAGETWAPSQYTDRLIYVWPFPC